MPSRDPNKPPPGFEERFDRIREHAGSFWERVTEGLQLQEIWTQFRAEARASYDLYSQELDWAALERESGWRKGVQVGRALFWAMLMKLSPARRIFLLIALLLVATAVIGLRPLGWPRGMYFLIAAGALVVLLGLELADRVAMKRDLEIAREIQRWLVPEVPPQVPGVEIAFATRPANTVAGDYYDAFFRPANLPAPDTGPLLAVVADVAGKSVPAALLMATFQASLQTLAAAPTSLVELVTGLNRYACAHSLGGLRFTTAFLAELYPATRELLHCNAGHNAPALRRISGGIERLEAGGFPLGISLNAHYDWGTTTLAPGDLLVIFTDGLIEAVNQQGEEYGEPRLLELLRAMPEENAAATLKRIMHAVDAFVGPARQHDDITCLVLRAM